MQRGCFCSFVWERSYLMLLPPCIPPQIPQYSQIEPGRLNGLQWPKRWEIKAVNHNSWVLNILSHFTKILLNLIKLFFNFKQYLLDYWKSLFVLIFYFYIFLFFSKGYLTVCSICKKRTGCPQKNALLWFYNYNSTLERARNNSRGCFKKFSKILYQIDTKIFQFDLLKVEKIWSKDGNPA